MSPENQWFGSWKMVFFPIVELWIPTEITGWLWAPPCSSLEGSPVSRPSWAVVPNRAWRLAGEKLPSAPWRMPRSAEPMRQMRGNRRWVFGVFLRICNWCSFFSLRCGFNNLMMIYNWLLHDLYNTQDRCINLSWARPKWCSMFHTGFSLTMLVFVAWLSTKSCHFTNGEMMHVSWYFMRQGSTIWPQPVWGLQLQPTNLVSFPSPRWNYSKECWTLRHDTSFEKWRVFLYTFSAFLFNEKWKPPGNIEIQLLFQ